MSLLAQATTDFKSIVEDDVGGFGWPITVTSPAGVAFAVKGLQNDISELIDPETNQLVVGRLAAIAVELGQFIASGGPMPTYVSEEKSKPWLVAFVDVGGTAHTFKVRESRPDRTVNALVLILEMYAP